MNNKNCKNVFSTTEICGERSYTRQVKVDSCHSLCNSHRPCNNGGKFDPESCEVCRSLFAKAKSSSPLAPVSKANLITLFGSMRSSSAFYQSLIWFNAEYKATWFYPIFTKPSRAKKSSTPANHAHQANLATHSTSLHNPEESVLTGSQVRDSHSTPQEVPVPEDLRPPVDMSSDELRHAEALLHLQGFRVCQKARQRRSSPHHAPPTR